MALSDKEVGSIMSRLMAERSKKNATGFENAEEAAEQTSAESAVGTSDGYDELLSDVLAGAQTPADPTGTDDDDADLQRRVDDLYSEFASSVRDDAGETVDEPDGDGEPMPHDVGSEDDSDSYLMAALGYSEAKGESPEVKKEKPARKPPLSERVSKADMASAFAWTGHEYTSKSQRGDLLRAYDFEHKKLYVRLFGTGIFFILILIFELFGDKFGGAFSKAEYPVVHVMTSLQLLLLCAVFSGKRLLSGFVDLFRGAPSIASLVSVSVGCAVIFDLIEAAALGGSENVGFTLYNVCAALSLVFLVVSDMIRLIAETRTFTKLSSFDSLCTLERVEDASGNAYRLHRGSFVRDYFKRTNRRGEGLKAGVYVIPAVFAIALILFFIALGSGRGFIPSLNTFICAVHFSLPAFAVIAFDLPFRILSLSRTGSYSVILNELDTAEFASVGKVVLDETDVFTGESLEINKVSQCVPHSNIFEILSVAGAVCSRVGGTLSRAFSTIS
ncbi:MAG: hypothetical protein ILO42_03160, partial [Clostridia bacterium]|nr:hypothetical protein [Clostridia bacterium]